MLPSGAPVMPETPLALDGVLRTLRADLQARKRMTYHDHLFTPGQTRLREKLASKLSEGGFKLSLFFSLSLFLGLSLV